MYFPQAAPGRKYAEQDIPKAVFLEALDRLNALLVEEGKRITFLAVGGGAMMLAYGTRDKTHDIDGVLYPANTLLEDTLHRLATIVAEQIKEDGVFPNMPDGWINVQVKSIMQSQTYSVANFESLPQYQWSNLKLLFAKPGYLLAMKSQALRDSRRDYTDVVSLVRLLGIKTLEEYQETVSPYMDWNYIGNDEHRLLQLAIAWAFPGETKYDQLRVRALRQYHKVKQGI